MGLFNKSKQPTVKQPLDELFEDDVATYSSSLNYLVGLSDIDFMRVVKVAEIHRKAYFDAAEVLSQPNEPTTFIVEPQPETTSSMEYIESESEPKPKTSKGKK